MEDKKMTKAQQLKKRIIEIARELLDEKESEITSGIEDGMYDELENEEPLENIEKARTEIKEFEDYTPEVLVYIEGGVLQGASATEDMSFALFDKDNYDQEDPDQRGEDDPTPEAWRATIKARTDRGDLTGVY